jgi:hypothetical protein
MNPWQLPSPSLPALVTSSSWLSHLRQTPLVHQFFYLAILLCFTLFYPVSILVWLLLAMILFWQHQFVSNNSDDQQLMSKWEQLPVATEHKQYLFMDGAFIDLFHNLMDLGSTHMPAYQQTIQHTNALLRLEFYAQEHQLHQGDITAQHAWHLAQNCLFHFHSIVLGRNTEYPQLYQKWKTHLNALLPLWLQHNQTIHNLCHVYFQPVQPASDWRKKITPWEIVDTLE